MFDLIANGHRQCPHGDRIPLVASLCLHSLLVLGVIVIPLMAATHVIPEVPHVLAFVASATPPPPPPPPAAAPPQQTSPPPSPQQGAPVNEFAAPLDAPDELSPANAGSENAEPGAAGGVEGGVVGGVPGGVIGGAIVMQAPAPPPSPPVAAAPADNTPIRVGGDIRTPRLVSRTNPVYPLLAVRAHVEGEVVLEAIVDSEGRVEDLRVLRSIPLLNKAAMDAVKQWRYAPLLLNGQPRRFVATVIVTFSLQQS